MKGLLYLTLSVLITAGTAAPAWAQFALTAPEIPVHSQAWQPSMDSDLRQIRLNAFPELRFRADDYIRCTPAAVLLLTKAFGYEGRSSWGEVPGSASEPTPSRQLPASCGWPMTGTG